MIMTTRQQALVSLMRLQALGVTDMEIKNMARLMAIEIHYNIPLPYQERDGDPSQHLFHE